MPTTKTRINITLPKTVEIVLNKIAKRDNMPVATKAQELLQFAIEIEEDQMWNSVAAARDKKNSKFIKHEQAWV